MENGPFERHSNMIDLHHDMMIHIDSTLNNTVSLFTSCIYATKYAPVTW